MPLTLMLKITCTASARTKLKTADNYIFLTHEAKPAFLQLKQTFTKAFILHCFDLKPYIQIKTEASSYAISFFFYPINPEICLMIVCSLFLWENDFNKDLV